MKISSTDRDIKAVLNSGFFVVPRFQRPYSWDRENVDEFWNDLISSETTDYFIGSMVTYKAKDGAYWVVDGQQRLTTITMSLAALRNAFAADGLADLANGIQTLIERKDVDNVPRFILKTETSYPYFQEQIQKNGIAELDGDDHFEERKLRAAFLALEGYVNGVVAASKTLAAGNAEKKKAEVGKALSEIRDRLLALKLIFIEVDDENDAYNLFETLNTRGKDLAVSDLVKNHFTRLIKPHNKQVDIAKAKWEEVQEIIEGSSADLSLDSFLHHYWLSKHEYVTIKQLFKQFRKKVIVANAKDYLAELVRDAKTYRQIHETGYRKWMPQEGSIRASLEALSLFQVTQPTPMVLSIMREFNGGRLKPKHTARALAALERFHFMVTAVTSQRSSGGVSAMYSAAARKLAACSSEQERLQIIDELINKLRERVPTEEEFEIGFAGILYSDAFTKQRRLVRYVLGRFFADDNPAVTADYSQMTIEHLRSQADPTTDEEKRATAELGNLVFVPSKLNSELDSKGFAQKKAILAKKKVALDKEVETAADWGLPQITARTKKMAARAYKKLWKID